MKRVLSNKRMFLQHVRASEYFHNLSHRSSELSLKYPTGDYMDMLSNGTRECTSNELLHAQQVLQVVHSNICILLPILQSSVKKLPAFNLVCLTNTSIEKGTSWTVGTTVVLASDDSLGHEFCHIYQRLFPIFFDRFYARYDFHPLPREDALWWVHKEETLMDNPDISSRYYLWKNRYLVLYNKSFSPSVIDIETGNILPPFLISILPKQKVMINHPHEMFAIHVSFSMQ